MQAKHISTTRLLLGTVLGIMTCAGQTASGQEPDNVPPPGFKALFNGQDFTGWKVPDGDHGHWKVMDGVIDYDAESEAPGDKSLWHTQDLQDFVLRVDWRIKETPYTNPNVPYILPDGTHARDIKGQEMKLALPDSDSGVYLRGSGKNQVNIWCWPIGSGEFYGYRTDPAISAEVRTGVTRAIKPTNRSANGTVSRSPCAAIALRLCSMVSRSSNKRSYRELPQRVPSPCNTMAASKAVNGTVHPACCNSRTSSSKN